MNYNNIPVKSASVTGHTSNVSGQVVESEVHKQYVSGQRVESEVHKQYVSGQRVESEIHKQYVSEVMVESKVGLVPVKFCQRRQFHWLRCCLHDDSIKTKWWLIVNHHFNPTSCKMYASNHKHNNTK